MTRKQFDGIKEVVEAYNTGLLVRGKDRIEVCKDGVILFEDGEDYGDIIVDMSSSDLPPVVVVDLLTLLNIPAEVR